MTGPSMIHINPGRETIRCDGMLDNRLLAD
jgi:hypothetical protein